MIAILDLTDAITHIQEDELFLQFIPGGVYNVVCECLYFLSEPMAVVYKRECNKQYASRADRTIGGYSFGDELVAFIEDSFDGLCQDDILRVHNTGTYIEDKVKDVLTPDILEMIKGKVYEINTDDGYIYVLRLKD